MSHAFELVSESNEQFFFEVSLRADVKQLDHLFFKSILQVYE